MNFSVEQYAELLDRTAGWLNGCPEAAQKAALRTAGENFINDTLSIRTDVPAPISPLEVYAPDGGVPLAVLKVVEHGEPVPQEMWRTFRREGTLVLKVEGFHRPRIAIVAYMPRGAPPADWFAAHSKAVADGALALLLSQRVRPWADPDGAARFDLSFRQAEDSANYEMRQSLGCGQDIFERDRFETTSFGGIF